MVIRRATTPTHPFECDVDLSIMAEIIITYSQRGIVVLEKRKKDCRIEGNTIFVKLTQEETLEFNPSYKVDIELTFKTLGGDVLKNEDPIIVTVKKSKNEDIL